MMFGSLTSSEVSFKIVLVFREVELVFNLLIGWPILAADELDDKLPQRPGEHIPLFKKLSFYAILIFRLPRLFHSRPSAVDQRIHAVRVHLIRLNHPLTWWPSISVHQEPQRREGVYEDWCRRVSEGNSIYACGAEDPVCRYCFGG